MKRILTWSLIALHFATTQPVFASEKVDWIVTNWKEAIETTIWENPIAGNLDLEKIEKEILYIKAKKKKRKFPTKDKLSIETQDEKTSWSIGAAIQGKSLAIPMEYVDKWEQVIVPVESIKKWADVWVPVESVKKWEKVLVAIESVKEWENVLVDIEYVKEWKKIVVPVESVKEWENVMVYSKSVKPWTKVEVPVESVKEWEKVLVAIESVKKWENVAVPIESVKKWEKVLAPVESVKEWKNVEISIEPKKEETTPIELAKKKKLKEYSHYKNSEQVFDLAETYKKNIEINFFNNKTYFWSFFVSIIDKENIDRNFLEILNKNSDIDTVKLTQLKKLISEKFGEDVYEKIYAYLFYISLNQVWEEWNALYLSYKKSGYRILTPEILEEIISKWFEITDKEKIKLAIGKAFTFQKLDETIEIISVQDMPNNVIWELSSFTIDNLETNFYSILDFIFETIENLPTTPLKDILEDEK